MAILGLSKDKSKSKSQSQNQSQSTNNQTTVTTLDPQYHNLVYNNAQASQNLANTMTPFGGQRVAGFAPDQLAAFDAMRGIHAQNVGAGTLAQGMDYARKGAAYIPERVQADEIGGMDMSRYMDPYVGQVVDASIADLDRARRLEDLHNDARATQAGAFGGTGAAVARSLTGDNYQRAVASQSASLRSQGWQGALNAASADLARRLAAAQSNQSAGLQTAQNQLAAAGLMGQMSDQELNQAITRAGLLRQIGDAGQALQQRGLDAAHQDWRDMQERQIALQNLINASIQLVPQTGTNFQTENSFQTGTSSQTGSTTNTKANLDLDLTRR